MKKLAYLFLLLSLLLPFSAWAEAALQYTGQVHPDLPSFTFTVTDTGEREDTLTREKLLQVSITAQDGRAPQQLTWRSSEATEQLCPFVQLEDMNFDGYNDLVLLTAMGAHNVFSTLSLWDEAAGCFRPVEQFPAWQYETKCFSFESSQLELCNYQLDPETGMLLSSVADGYRYHTNIVYGWEGRYGLTVRSVADVYDAGKEMIGETVLLYGTDVMRCWDEAYPESWYYEQDGVLSERSKAIREVTMGNAAWDPTLLQVANVDWVNLRKQDSKASPSLARLNAGETVVLLVDECGPENGWVRVWYRDGSDMLTGYIWHSFLEPCEP